jgi:hypothetical protein
MLRHALVSILNEIDYLSDGLVFLDVLEQPIDYQVEGLVR